MAPSSSLTVPGFSERTGSSVPVPLAGIPGSKKRSLDPKNTLNGHETDALPSKEYHLKLISVTYKEAALDSPSFRASVNHMDTQLQQTEDWFLALADSFMKVPQKVEEFRSVFAILDYLVPSFLQDSLVDQEYSLAMLHQSKQTLKKLWATAFSVFRINVSTMEQRKIEFLHHVARFKRFKRDFLQAQEKYDRYYQIHMNTPKFKDPALLFEDSRQLAGVRREYASLSVALVVETQKLTEKINATILSLNELFWRIKIEHLEGGFLDEAQLQDVWKSVGKLRAWHDSCQKASEKLDSELTLARRNIEQHVLESHLPAATVDDYRPEFINSRVLGDISEPAVEKFGYICMKTYSEKSSKPLWVKRWAFIRNGVLGFLVLAPSLESVQETDKIGVLLCNVKYTQNEDRHFCFEVKTIDTTIVIQAETLHELKSWLKVFENARTRIIDEKDPMHALLDIASSRYPPLVAEFSAATNTSADREITSKYTYNSVGDMIKSRRLSVHLERNEAFFSRYVLDSVGRINLPIVTSSTKSALIAGTLAGQAPVFPTALDSNISGSVNWALSTMVQIPSKAGASKGLAPAQTKSVGSGRKYPKNFPNTWVARDLQMRALFESSVGANEYCVLSYNCLLSPNESQELRATHYLTQVYLYSYIHSSGFVSMSKMPLDRFVEASCTTSKTHDTLRLILVQGQLLVKLFLEEGMLVERKLNFLFQNLASDSPLETFDTIAELLAIESAFESESRAKLGKALDPGMPMHFESLKAGQKTRGSYYESITFEKSLPFMAQRTVSLPPKAIFHVLCGSESEILNVLNAMVEVQFSERSSWKKSADGKNHLIRDNRSAFKLPTGQLGSVKVTQRVETQVDNEFYSITITKSALKVFCGPRLQFVTRITIHRSEAERSVIKIYGQPIIDESLLHSFVAQRLCKVFIRGFARHVLKEIDVAINIIGNKGKILKAVYFYGKILIDEEPYSPVAMDPVPVGRFALVTMSLQLMAADAFRALTTWCFVLVNAIKYAVHKITLHAGLIAIIILLTLSNVYFSGISTRQYWVSRQSSNLIKDLLTVEPMQIKRAIYLQDIRDLVNEEFALSNDSACFQAFKKESSVLNYQTFMAWNQVSYENPISTKRKQLHDRLTEIAIKRNDLLVSLKLLNHSEEEEARLEWRDWLIGELATCNQVGNLNMSRQSEIAGDQLNSSMELLGDYCDSCALELSAVTGIL